MSTTAPNPLPTITDLIRKDHAQVADIFRRYQTEAPAHAKHKLVGAVSQMLEIQTQLKDEIFFPALRALATDETILTRSAAARHQMHSLIGQLRDMRPTATLYDDTFTTLNKVFNDHATEEEAVLLHAERLLPDQLIKLGARMRTRRQVLSRPRMGQVGALLLTAGILVAGGYLIKRALERRL